MKLSTLGIPLLLGVGAVFYLVDSNKLPSLDSDKSPEVLSPKPAVTIPTKRKPRGYAQCIAFSNEQYRRDMRKFRRIAAQPDVNYGRIRDDRYGKGLNTITIEQLEREKKCSEAG